MAANQMRRMRRHPSRECTSAKCTGSLMRVSWEVPEASRQSRLLAPKALVGLKLAHETADVLTLRSRRAVVAKSIRLPRLSMIRTDLVVIDARPAARAVRSGHQPAEQRPRERIQRPRSDRRNARLQGHAHSGAREECGPTQGKKVDAPQSSHICLPAPNLPPHPLHSHFTIPSASPTPQHHSHLPPPSLHHDPS